MGFLTFVFVGALCGSIVYVASFVGLFFTLTGPLTVVMPVRRIGIVGFLWRVYSFPILAGALATGAGLGLSLVVPWHGILATITLRTAGNLAVFVGAVALFRPKPARDLAQRLGLYLRP